MEFIVDFVGNEVRVGDEVIYIGYKEAHFEKIKVESISKTGLVNGGKTRFIKVVKEVSKNE